MFTHTFTHLHINALAHNVIQLHIVADLSSSNQLFKIYTLFYMSK